MARFQAKLTSKNQLTLPAGISALLHARPGDVVLFDVDDASGEIKLSGPDIRQRLAEWSGRWADREPAMTESESDAWIREVRGERE